MRYLSFCVWLIAFTVPRSSRCSRAVARGTASRSRPGTGLRVPCSLLRPCALRLCPCFNSWQGCCLERGYARIFSRPCFQFFAVDSPGGGGELPGHTATPGLRFGGAAMLGSAGAARIHVLASRARGLPLLHSHHCFCFICSFRFHFSLFKKVDSPPNP